MSVSDVLCTAFLMISDVSEDLAELKKYSRLLACFKYVYYLAVRI